MPGRQGPPDSSGWVGGSTRIGPNDIQVFKKGPLKGLQKTNRGVSLDLYPENVAKHGVPHRVKSVPNELRIVQQGGRPEHYIIAPKEPMAPKRFRELCNLVEFFR